MEISSKVALYRWGNIVAFVATVIMNGLAGSSTIVGGKVTAEISDAYPTLITPAGFTFAIWGVIYLLLGVFVVYQALPSQKEKGYIEKIGPFFVLSSVLNIAWLFLWQYEFVVFSVVLIFLLLASLITIYLRLNVGRSKAPTSERLAVHLPFSVYLGWITIASIANVSVALVSVNWDGFGISPETWAMVVLVIALIIALLVVLTRRDPAYGLVVIWALFGISSKQAGNQSIVNLAYINIAIVAVAIVGAIALMRFRGVRKAGN